MLISYKKKFIFIHIFKTAGTSTMDVFLPYARFIDRLVYQFWVTKKLTGAINRITGTWDQGKKMYTGYHKHATIREVKEKFNKELFDRFFKFAFVRNPYDWLVSFYFYVKQSSYHPYNKIANEFNFDDFIRWYLEKDPPLQSDFLINKDNEVIMDYIGKLEGIEADLELICNKLQIPFKGIKHKNISKKREEGDFKNYFNQALLEEVNDYFEKDFKMLGYSKM